MVTYGPRQLYKFMQARADSIEVVRIGLLKKLKFQQNVLSKLDMNYDE